MAVIGNRQLVLTLTFLIPPEVDGSQVPAYIEGVRQSISLPLSLMHTLKFINAEVRTFTPKTG